MSTYCEIEDGVVVNRAIFDGPMPPGWPGYASWVASETAQIGWYYADGVFIEPPPPPVDTIPFEPWLQNTTLYDHENRLRSLEGQPPLPLGDFIAKAAGGGPGDKLVK